MAPGVDPTVNPDKQLQEKESALLQKYARFIRTFLTTIDSQVTALHALQVFCFSHNFPKGLLLRWFIALYNLEVIEEEAYHKWRDTVTDAYPGKGKALFQVNVQLLRLLNIGYYTENSIFLFKSLLQLHSGI